MELNGKRLLILGGSRISCEIVKHARRMGITTGVTDWYPLEKSPAKQLADEAYFVSTTDYDAMTALILEQKFDGVFTGFTDSALPHYAEICARAGKPAYGTREQFELFINKNRYKKLLREFGVPTIPEYEITPETVDGAAISYPVIVKPGESSGARGITVCRSARELKQAMALAAQTSESDGIVAERYMEGPEATVFWLFADGQYRVTALGNRHVKQNQDGVIPLPVGYTYPAAVLPGFLRDAAPKMEEMFRSVGVRNGMMFMQCKVADGTCYVYDMGYRLTGSLEYINLRALCGFDPMDMMIRFALTGSMGPGIEKADPFFGGKFAYNVSLLCRPGKIARIEGLEAIKKLPGVLDVVVSHPVGTEITPEMKGLLAQITVRVLGRADDSENMKKEMLEIRRLAHVISAAGEEMLLPGMDASDFAGTVYV